MLVTRVMLLLQTVSKRAVSGVVHPLVVGKSGGNRHQAGPVGTAGSEGLSVSVCMQRPASSHLRREPVALISWRA